MKNHLSLILILLFLSGNLFGQGQSYPKLELQKFYGSKGNEEPTSIAKSLDGNIILGGNRETNNDKNVWILKVSPKGGVIWELEIGKEGFDEIRDLVVCADSSIVFSGVTSSFIDHTEERGDLGGDMFVGKISNNGEIKWLRSYGGTRLDASYSITHGNFGDVVVSGVTHSDDIDLFDFNSGPNSAAFKINENGIKRRGYMYGGSRHDLIFSSARCQNGDYLYCGFTNSEDIDNGKKRSNGDGWLIRTTSFGEIKWQRIFSGRFEEFFTDVKEDTDGRIILCGNFETEKKGKQFWFLKLTAEGKKISEKVFGGAQNEYASSIIVCSEGGYLMSGYSSYNGLESPLIKGKQDFWIIRLDELGDITWQNTFGGRDNERCDAVMEFEPGSFYAIGTKENDFSRHDKSFNNGNDYWMIKIREEKCADYQCEIYTSLNDNTAYVDRAFKFKAITEEGDRFLWDFGDGTTSKQQFPNKSYDLPGIYEVKLIVHMNENCRVKLKYPYPINVW